MRRASIGLVALGVLLVPGAARPCDLVPEVGSGLTPTRAGASPLLISTAAEVTLTDPTERVWPVERVTIEALEGVTSLYGERLYFFRPVQPLPPNGYRLSPPSSAGRDPGAIIVVTSNAPVVHGTGTRATLAAEEYEPSGCGASCGVSTTRITLHDAELHPTGTSNFLLSFELEDGTTKKFLVGYEPERATQHTILMYRGPNRDEGVGDYGFCGKISALGWNGTLGNEVDAGCFVPEGGCRCATRRTGTWSAPVLLLLAGAGVLRRRLRRAG